MSNLLNDQTAVITGAASGNGRGIAKRFAEEGADVVVADIQEEDRLGGESTHEMIESETEAQATYVQCDVTDRDSLKSAIDAAEEFGGVDSMVNNAGIVDPQKPLTEVDYEEYRRLMDINLDSVYFGTQIAAQRMIDQGNGGSVINLSSTAGIEGGATTSAYSTSKGGVRLFTYAAAADLGRHGIRVNAIHPGAIETAMTREDSPIFGTDQEAVMTEATPIGRLGQPEDVGDLAVFLASDLSSFITAESILLDGGSTNTS